MFDIVTIGTATIDIVAKLGRIAGHTKDSKNIHTPAKEWCFPLGSKIEIDDLCVVSGGGATNAAVTFSRFGLITAAVFEVGNDTFGKIVIDELRRENVQVFVSKNKRLSTAGSLILVSTDGERTVFVHRGAANNLTLGEIPLSKLKARWVYMAPGSISYKTIHSLIYHFKKQGIKIALNPSRYLIEQRWQKLKLILREVDVFIVNQEEASYITGIPCKEEKQIFSKLDKWVKGVLVVTSGSGGVKVSDGHSLWQAGIFKNKKIIDRLGAGDAFGSGFIVGLIATGEKCEKGACGVDNIKYAIRLGSANATSVVEFLGAKRGILTKEQFEKERRWQKLTITVAKL